MFQLDPICKTPPGSDVNVKQKCTITIVGKNETSVQCCLMLFYIFYPKFSCGVWSYLRNKKIGQERDLDFTMVVLQFSRPSSSPHKAGRRQLRPFEGGRQCAHAAVNVLFTPVCWSPPTKDWRKEISNARSKKYWLREEILNAQLKKYWMCDRRNIECASEEILNARSGGHSHTTRAHLERVSKSIGFGRLSKTNELLFSLGLIAQGFANLLCSYKASSPPE